jgi:hypothetical protein
VRASSAILWLRVEGLAVLLLSLLLYAQHGLGWFLFALLLLVPDLSMTGYLAGPRWGALSYNLFHTYTAPLLLAAAGLSLQHTALTSVALIWSAHIGLDRMLGYGLKLPSGFKDTHLGVQSDPAPGLTRTA